MSNTDDFKILKPRDAVRLRIQMYLGSPQITTEDRMVFGKTQSVTYVPALNKAIDEIVDNAVDEAIRTNFKFATKIDVKYDGTTFSVEDNGRGIPHDLVLDEVSGKEISKPMAAWTRVHAGTSFSDQRETGGTNGVGSSCVNFCSTKFVGKTWRDGKLLTIVSINGAEEIQETITAKIGKPGTMVEFTPDPDVFETPILGDLDTLLLLEDRVQNLQLCFPEIKFSLNGKEVKVKTLKDYVLDNFKTMDDVVFSQTKSVSFVLGTSETGFRSNSFVNNINTRSGGTHVDLLANRVAERLVELIKKTHKLTIQRNAIKEGFTLLLIVRHFKDPRFDSQTKERLTSPTGPVSKHYDESGAMKIEQIAKSIMSKPAILDPIIEAELAKKLAAERRAATNAAKKASKMKVAKHVAASKPGGNLLLLEGDSASGQILNVRDPMKIGYLPLRGVIKNTWGLKPHEVLANKELTEMMAVIGLDIRDKDSWRDAYYANIWITVDADHDGAGHIAPLLIGFFQQFWPGMVESGRVHVVRSPMQISTNGKKSEWFYDYDKAAEFKEKNPKWDHRYIKGLAQLTSDEYSVIVNTPRLDTITVDDMKYFEIMMGGNADMRKEFLIEG